MAEGIAKFDVRNEYRFAQSASTEPGSVIRSFTCRRLRNVIFELLREFEAVRRNSAAGAGHPANIPSRSAAMTLLTIDRKRQQNIAGHTGVRAVA